MAEKKYMDPFVSRVSRQRKSELCKTGEEETSLLVSGASGQDFGGRILQVGEQRVRTVWLAQITKRCVYYYGYT